MNFPRENRVMLKWFHGIYRVLWLRNDDRFSLLHKPLQSAKRLLPLDRPCKPIVFLQRIWMTRAWTSFASAASKTCARRWTLRTCHQQMRRLSDLLLLNCWNCKGQVGLPHIATSRRGSMSFCHIVKFTIMDASTFSCAWWKWGRPRFWNPFCFEFSSARAGNGSLFSTRPQENRPGASTLVSEFLLGSDSEKVSSGIQSGRKWLEHIRNKWYQCSQAGPGKLNLATLFR